MHLMFCLDLSESVRYASVDGTTWNAKRAKLNAAGYARSNSIRKGFRYTKPQKEFLNWCFDRGEKNPALKMTAEKAYEAMEMKGTSAGEAKYPDEPMMKKSEDGSPCFDWQTLIYVKPQNIRSYFSKMKADQRKKKKIERKQVSEA